MVAYACCEGDVHFVHAWCEYNNDMTEYLVKLLTLFLSDNNDTAAYPDIPTNAPI